MGNDVLPWVQHISPLLLDTGRAIGTETCKLDNVCPPYDLWFGSDPNTICVLHVICI